MCLAAPPTNRNPQYAVPYNFPVVKGASSFKSADSSSPGAAHRPFDGRQPRSQKLDNIGDAFGPFLDLPNTPHPVDVVGNFPGALGPTGLSPVGRDSHAPGVVVGVDPDKLAAPPLIPIGPSSNAGAAAVATSARRVSSTKQRRRRGPQRPGKTATDKERLFVKHDYHDLSAEPDALQGGEAAINNGRASSSSANLTNESFPMKIHRILEESTDDPSQNHIICWQPHGRAFKIRNPKLFTERIMPRYFPKMKKLTSLQRQFNLYGFERLTRDGPDAGAYYHEAFLRHRPGLISRRMVRRKIKGTGYKAASNPEAEPDLYAFPFMQENMNTRKRGYEGEEATSAIHGHQQQLSAVPVKSNPFASVHVKSNDPCSCPTGYPSCSFNGNDQDTVTGIVTESTKSDISTSYDSSSSEELTFQQKKALEHWVSNTSTPAAAMRSHLVPQAVVHSNNPSTIMDAGRNIQDQLCDSIISSPSMEDFLSLPEATQDSFLRDFFSTNDVTPLVPGFDPSSSDAAATSHAGHPQQEQEQLENDRAILLEFANIWESSSCHLK